MEFFRLCKKSIDGFTNLIEMVPFLSRQTHGGGSGNLVLDDELKPMHHKDIKPPPEFSWARKDLVAWHESFASTLRCTTPKWATVIDWIKGPQ